MTIKLGMLDVAGDLVADVHLRSFNLIRLRQG